MSFVEVAHAMAPQAGGGGEANLFASLMPFALIFIVFYFLLIRPQQKKAKEHKQMLSNLKVGDPVMTAGGIYGRIVEVDGDLMVVDLGETKVTMNRGFLTVAQQQQRQAVPPLKREKKGKKDSKDVRKTISAVEIEEDEKTEDVAEILAEAPADVEVEESQVVSGDSDKDKPAVQ